MEKEKLFTIVKKYEVSIEVPAENLKEAKAFADDYMDELMRFDDNELNNVGVNYITAISRPKVYENKGESVNEQEKND